MAGYIHFNTGGGNTTFTIEIFGEDLEIYQMPSDQTIGHGAVVWDSAVVFSKYMEVNNKDFEPRKLKGKRVLELGSGTGLAGICFMMRGAEVTFTDLEPVIRGVTERNVNNCHRQLTCSGYDVISPSLLPLDWTELSDIAVDDDLTQEEKNIYDIILLTDCVFSVSLVRPLVNTIRKYAGEKTSIICVYEIRDVVANDAFLKELGSFFAWKRIPRGKFNPEYSNESIVIVVAKPLRSNKASTGSNTSAAVVGEISSDTATTHETS